MELTCIRLPTSILAYPYVNEGGSIMKTKVAVSLRPRLFVLLGLSSFLIILSVVVLKGEPHAVGAVYTMTNDPAGNAVLVFNRFADGTLTPGGSFSTRGLGRGG